MRGRVDGLILMAPESSSAGVVDRIRRWLPVVLLNPRFDHNGCPAVSVANFEGALAAVAHLVALGHRAIAMVTGPEGNTDADERRRGYRRALEEAGLAPSPRMEIAGDFTESTGAQAADSILALRPRPTAVFAANDSMAIGLLSVLASRGIDVPGDMSLVGFDDISIARYVNPPLTTVHVDAFRLGARAVELALESGNAKDPQDDRPDRPAPAPDGPNGPVTTMHEVLPTPLVVRRSSGANADARGEAQAPGPADRRATGREEG
jgi:LacI family transcriptional regulator